MVLVKSVSGAAAHTVPAGLVGLVEDPNVTLSFLQVWNHKSGINMHKWNVGTISARIFCRRWLLLDSRTHANWSCRRWHVASRSASCVKSIWHDLTIQTLVQQTFWQALRKALSRDEACCIAGLRVALNWGNRRWKNNLSIPGRYGSFRSCSDQGAWLRLQSGEPIHHRRFCSIL